MLDQSNNTSGNRSSQVFSELANSFLCSPKPERIESIPKPQSGLGIIQKHRNSILPGLNQFSLNYTKSDKKEYERPKSTQRTLVKSRFEKLEIVSYKNKRSEHIIKHSSRVRDQMSSKNLLSELRKIEVKRNT